MKFKLPVIGEVAINEPIKEIIKETKAIKQVEKSLFGGGFLDFGNINRSDSISGKLLEANTGWVYRNNDVIAREVSGIEFELFTTRVVGQDIEYRPILSHACLDALDKFNSFTDASSGFYMTQSHRKLTGNSFWYIDGNGPRVDGIYILMPDKVKIVPTKTSDGSVEVERYEYRDSVGGKTIDQTYTPDQIIHFKIPNPKNYLRGLGVPEAVAADIDLDNLAVSANIQMFKRGLIGNFALSTDKSVTQEQLKQIRAEFRSAYGGVENAYKVPILSGGLEPKNLQMTNKDMEFMALQTWTRDKITSAFGNSKAVLGITEDVNRSNAESTILNWKQTTIRGEMKGITDALNEFFVPRFGKNLILGFKDPVGEDKTTDIEAVRNMIEANVITPNEAREILGYEPLPDKDNLRESLSIPLIPKSLRYVNRDKLLRANGLYEKAEKYAEIKKLTLPLAKKILASKKKAEPTPVAELAHSSYYDKQIQLVEVMENSFRNKLQQFINRLVEKAVTQIPHEVAEMQSKQLFNDEDEIDEAVLIFTPLLMELAAASGTQALNLINSDNPYLASNLRGYVEQRVKLFATSMVTTDREKLIDIIVNGVREGLTVPQITNQITDTFESYSKAQAERVTRTEVLRVANQAALDAWEQSGEVQGKQWLAAPGADELCAQYDGEIVWDLGGNFYSPENEFEDGDPPIHVNCRCVVLPVTESFKNLEPEQLKEMRLQKEIKRLQEELSSADKRTKEAKAKMAELEKYNQELEDYLEEA